MPNLNAAALARAAAHPDEIVLTESRLPDAPSAASIASRKQRGRLELPRSEFVLLASRVANFLKQSGVEVGDRVATMPGLRHEWLVIREGIRLAGAAHVAIFAHYGLEQMGHILRDSEPKVVFIENEEQRAKLLELERNGAFSLLGGNVKERVRVAHVVSLEEVQSGEAVDYGTISRDARYVDPLFAPWTALDSDTLADVNYTSGTKGIPKGVMQSHASHLANIVQILRSGIFAPDMRMFTLLRAAHSYCLRMWDMATVAGGEVLLPAVTDRKTTHLTDERRLSIQRDARELPTEVLVTAPAALKAMLDKAEQHPIAGRYVRAIRSGEAVGWLGKRILEVVRAQLFSAELKYVVSGGARLDERDRRALDQLRAPTYNGAGATELDVVAFTNTPTANRPGTVGMPLPGVEVGLFEHGDGRMELTVAGPQVSSGYWRLPQATAKAFRDGRYFTGDIGRIDDDGFIVLEGRMDDCVKTLNGEKVPLESLEERLRDDCIRELVVIADGRPYCSAIIAVKGGVLRARAKERGAEVGEPVESDPVAQQLVREFLTRFNASLREHHLRIRNFRLVPFSEFSEETGVIGPTTKLRRPGADARFAPLIESMYADSEIALVPVEAGSQLEPARSRFWPRVLQWPRRSSPPKEPPAPTTETGEPPRKTAS